MSFSVTFPLEHVNVLQYSFLQDSPFFLGGDRSVQSRVVVNEVAAVVEVKIGDVSGELVLDCKRGVVVLNGVVVGAAVVLRVGLVGHGIWLVSILQEALQYATKHHPNPSVTLYTKSPGWYAVPLLKQEHTVVTMVPIVVVPVW